ncbi:conserved Plasmodium protein, unknown function [Plasmodium malariae]|uniref:Uncharacterized protein n=1 Tax=Plasmodium malariae TaxID=5858 RepID=A0A1A8WUZ1_PLAMA|nr:conserved Plasmodium protein, unknown function [Plasmodium malariae]
MLNRNGKPDSRLERKYINRYDLTACGGSISHSPHTIPERSSTPILSCELFRNKDNQKSCSYLLKSAVLNLNHIIYLLGRNNNIYVELAQYISYELQYLEQCSKCNMDRSNKLNEGSRYNMMNAHNNSSCISVSLTDLIYVFNFYIYMKYYCFHFFIIILRLIEKASDISNINHKMIIRFLESCIKLKNEINKSMNNTCKRKYFNKRYQRWFYYRFPSSYCFLFIRNSIFKKKWTLSIHSLSPIMRGDNYSRKSFNSALSSSPRSTISSAITTSSTATLCTHNILPHLRSEIKKKRCMHFVLQKRKCYINTTYAKYRKRKHNEMMNTCNELLHRCTTLFFNRHIDVNLIMSYVKMATKWCKCVRSASRTSGCTSSGADAQKRWDRLTSAVEQCLKKNCAYFHTDEVVGMINFLMEEKYNSKELKDPIKHICRKFCVDCRRNKSSEYYSVKEIRDIVSLLAKRKHFDENFLTCASRYIIDNMDTINSNNLTQIVINMYRILKYNKNELLYEILNRYNPPDTRKSRKYTIVNSFFLEKTKMKYRKKGIRQLDRSNKKMCIRWGNSLNSFSYSMNCDNKEKDVEDNKKNAINFRKIRNFDKVKIKKLLQFIKVLIDNNIYIDSRWSEYFFSLIKNKYVFIKTKNYHLLCFALLHIELKKNITKFFHPYSKYNIYSTYSFVQIVSTNNLSSLIQITLLFSFYMHKQGTTLFFALLFNILRKFCKRSKGILTGMHDWRGSNCANGEIVFPHSSTSYIQDDHIIETYSQSAYSHDMKIYEKNKNNKYQKKKEKKKKFEFMNKIDKVKIPSCDLLEWNVPHNRVAHENVLQIQKQIQYELHQLHELQKDEPMQCHQGWDGIVQRGGELSLIGASSESRSSDSILNEHRHFRKNGSSLEPCGFAEEKNVKGGSFKRTGNARSREIANCGNDNTYSLSHIADIAFPDGNVNRGDTNVETAFYKSKKEKVFSTECNGKYDSDYFDQLNNSRNVLLIINNLFFHIKMGYNGGSSSGGSGISSSSTDVNSCLLKSENTQSCSANFTLEQLTIRQLLLLYEAYTLCCSYIDHSLKTIKIMNNDKNAISSKFHKQVASVVAQLSSKSEVINELVHHPFQRKGGDLKSLRNAADGGANESDVSATRINICLCMGIHVSMCVNVCKCV